MLSVSNQITDGLSGFSKSPEGYHQFGVQTFGEGSQNLERVGSFSGKGGRTYNYNYNGPVVTLADTLRFNTVEEDDGVLGSDESFPFGIPFDSISPTDWYDNTVR